LRQQAEQSGERQARLHEDLAEVRMQIDELAAVRGESEERVETLDGELAEWQGRYADAEISGEALHSEAESARQRLRDLERQAQEADYALRSLQARRTELERNRRLAEEQARRALDELEGLQGELFELD